MLCKSIEDIPECITANVCPIYCWSKDDITEFFGLSHKSRVEEIAKAAWKSEIPSEFKEIFEAILETPERPEHERPGRETYEVLLDGFTLHDGLLSYNGRVGKLEYEKLEGKDCVVKAEGTESAGGYKKLKRKVRRDEGRIVLSGSVYRKSSEIYAPGDRITIENDNGDGYGIRVEHDARVAIEKWKNGNSEGWLVEEPYSEHLKDN